MKLTMNDIFPVLKATFPVQNNYYPCSYQEEFEDLTHFGIVTVESLSELVTKHLDAVMAEDADVDLDEATYDYFCDEMGKSVIDERLDAGYWYSFPALLRLALQEEFGERYLSYAYEREGFDD